MCKLSAKSPAKSRQCKLTFKFSPQSDSEKSCLSLTPVRKTSQGGWTAVESVKQLQHFALKQFLIHKMTLNVTASII